MTNELLLSKLFAALGIVVIEQTEDGSFTINGTIPNWFLHFYEYADSCRERIRLERSTFLENFLVDAKEFWASNKTQPLKSGLWCEDNLLGNEYHFEATAIKLKNRNILLIEQLESLYNEKFLLIQKGRENLLTHQKLIKEIQKKEILLHCLVHDLSSPLTVISTSFDLLEREELTPKRKRILEVCKLQCTKQEMLISEMLNTFSADVESLEAFAINPEMAPDALLCIREIMEALTPTFYLKNIELRLDPNIDIAQDWKVVGEKLRLERIIANLLENAFRYSPKSSIVQVGLQEQKQEILISVEDEGSGVCPELSKNLFKKFSQGKNKSGKAGLGLYFCRITVERWGGTIGYSPRSTGGSRFWFCLPRPLET